MPQYNERIHRDRRDHQGPSQDNSRRPMNLQHVATSSLPTRHGLFAVHVFEDERGLEHVALVAGHPTSGSLVRLHSECATADIFGSLRCDCGEQLEESMRRIAAEGGVLIYLRGHEGRGIGLGNKIKAYALQDRGLNTIDANLHLGLPVDSRNYQAAVAILRHFGIDTVKLLTNNPQKAAALAEGGIVVAEMVALWTTPNPHNFGYIDTKKRLMGHSARRADYYDEPRRRTGA